MWLYIGFVFLHSTVRERCGYKYIYCIYICAHTQKYLKAWEIPRAEGRTGSDVEGEICSSPSGNRSTGGCDPQTGSSRFQTTSVVSVQYSAVLVAAKMLHRMLNLPILMYNLLCLRLQFLTWANLFFHHIRVCLHSYDYEGFVFLVNCGSLFD